MKYQGTGKGGYFPKDRKFESKKAIFEKLAEQGFLKKIEPAVRGRKKKVVEPEKNK